MRRELLYNPRLLCERLAIESIRRRRLERLYSTPGEQLSSGHIDSLELLELAAQSGIKTVYDVGANVGTWSLLAKSIIPDAELHAFEPLPKHQDGFVDNVSGVGNITLHRIALGSESKNATLHITDFSDESSMLAPAPASKSGFGIQEVQQFPIQLVRLDDYRAVQKLPWPDLIKLDVQGYELEVLKGARECIRATKAVLSEVSFVDYYEGQCHFHEVVGYLAETGLFVHAFGINTSVGRAIGQTDVLFMRKISR